MDYLKDAFLIDVAVRYDIKGRKYINSPMKIYFVDVGLIEVRETDHLGNRVRKPLEIDFIACQGNNKYYIQSAFSIPDEEQRAQEERPLLNVGDSFKKIIVVGSHIRLKRNDMGITTMGIRQFLLDQNSLNL